MIELMIGVAIVGTLSAVALPQLAQAQKTAKSSAARSTAINTAKNCSIAIFAGTKADGNVDKNDYTGDVTTAADITCDVSTPFAFTGGGKTWTVTLDANGVGGPAS